MLGTIRTRLGRDRDDREADGAGDTDDETETSTGRNWLGPLAGLFEDDPLPRADLLDGTEALFVDPAATQRHLRDYQLVAFVHDDLPAPAVLANDATLEIDDEAALAKAGPSTLALLGDRRIIVRDYALVPGDRAAAVDPDQRRPIPSGLAGETIPERPCQSQRIRRALLTAVADDRGAER